APQSRVEGARCFLIAALLRENDAAGEMRTRIARMRPRFRRKARQQLRVGIGVDWALLQRRDALRVGLVWELRPAKREVDAKTRERPEPRGRQRNSALGSAGARISAHAPERRRGSDEGEEREKHDSIHAPAVAVALRALNPWREAAGWLSSR